MMRFLSFILLFHSTLLFGVDERLERLSATHRDWLEEQVPYIITERERDVFLSLQTEQERNGFLVAFWKRRDPNPVTPANEFKDEHYRRLAYANDLYARDTHREGWRTDRGRYYITLGEPREIQPFESAELVSAELWFYASDPELGLPPFFYLLFYRPNNVGEFRLYHPVVDGPSALLFGRPDWDDQMALPIISEVSQELRRVSLSLDPSEPANYLQGRASPGTDLLLSRIDDAPRRRISTDYLDGFLRYGNRVSSGYSFNFVPNRSLFSVFRGPRDVHFVHFSLELAPEHFDLQTDENKTSYYTTVNVGIEARTLDGELVVSKEHDVFVELTASEFKRVQSFPVAFQEAFPLVAGEFQLSVILKNPVSSQYTVAEQTLRVEYDSVTPAVSALVFGYEQGIPSEREGEVLPFSVGGVSIRPAAEPAFVAGSTAEMLIEIANAASGSRLSVTVRSEGELVLEKQEPVSEGNSVAAVSLPLLGVESGRYVVHATLLLPDGTAGAERDARFVVSPKTAIDRSAFVARRGFNANEPGLLDMEIAEQYLGLGDIQRARSAFERSAAKNNPKLPMARWQLATLLLAEGNADRGLEILLPMEKAHGRQYEVVAGLGFGFYIKRSYEKARSYFERAIALKPAPTILLNAMGDCYELLGERTKAKETFERSLERDPNQPEVRKRLQAFSDEPS